MISIGRNGLTGRFVNIVFKIPFEFVELWIIGHVGLLDYMLNALDCKTGAVFWRCVDGLVT